MMEEYTKIFIRGLRLDMSIGVFDHEKTKTQPVIVDLEATVKLSGALNEDVGNVVRYDTIAKEIRAIASQGHINLVETLAEAIAQTCLKDEKIRDVMVKIAKPDAITDAEAAGAEIFRKRR